MAKYDRVCSSEDSSDEHLMSNNPASLYSPKTLRRSKSSIKTCLLVYIALLTTAVVILTAAILNQLQLPTNGSSCQASQVFTAAYGHNYALMSVDHKYDSLWEGQEGHSEVIHIPDDESDGELLPGVYSMFHQLHCLSSLRHAIQMARDGVDPGLDYKDNKHWPHCMDYLRKTILCWADDTVERQALLRNGTKSLTIDGLQDMRQCGNSRALIKTMRDQGKIVTTEPFPA